MISISAIIIDDESHNRSTLRRLLATDCKCIEVIAEASDADEAFLKINEFKPQLIFLDIRMPKKTGFDLLKMFPEINFEVIFVTAFDKYAIRAFEFNALGYILKPIDVSKLKKAVEKAKDHIQNSQHNDLVLHFVQSLSNTDDLLNKFSVHHNGKVVFINVTDISVIEAQDEHTTLTLADHSRYYSSKDLGQFETVLEEAKNFIRINKSVIINTAHIKSYSKGEPCLIEMKTNQTYEVSRRRKAEILKKLKEL